jgi:hypothetical protein
MVLRGGERTSGSAWKGIGSPFDRELDEGKLRDWPKFVAEGDGPVYSASRLGDRKGSRGRTVVDEEAGEFALPSSRSGVGGCTKIEFTCS